MDKDNNYYQRNIYIFFNWDYVCARSTLCATFCVCCSRRCGEVFCGKCSQYRRRLSLFATPDPNGISYRVSTM